MASQSRIQERLKAATDEAEKAIADLQSLVKGGVNKKKANKRPVNIYYDSEGTRIIKNPRRKKTAESASACTSSTRSNSEASSGQESGSSGMEFIESVNDDHDPAFVVEFDSEENDSMLEEAFAEAEKLIEASVPSASQRTWQTRQTRLETNWEGYRANLAYYAICQEALTFPQHCSKCSVALEQCVVRCLDCGPGMLLCSECDMQTHDHNPIHDREAWNGNFFIPILPTEGVDSQGKLISVGRFVPCSSDAFCCPKCEGAMKAVPSQSKCILINLKGRFDLHMPLMLCSSCNDTMEVSLVHLGYWPGSPTNASYFFDHDLFQFWDIMQKNMPGSSSSAFVKTLSQISEKKGRSGTITPATFSKAFQEWRYCQFDLRRVAGTDHMICPCCSKGQLACHMDGNRKTYRWKKVNAGSLEPYHGETFFCDDRKVQDSLEQTYQHKSTKVNGQDSCGQVHWQAAKTKAKSLQKLDETGVMVAGCRHALMQKAVNMWTGEMYGYGFYLQKYVLPTLGIKFLFYDVICKYWPWIQKVCQGDQAVHTSVIPALGQMHGKLHKWTCRVLFGSQWQDGAGMTSGEEMETAFQYLSRCGSTTKNMTRAGRMEQLTEHVIFWNEKKILSLPKYLSLRFVKILKEIKTQSEELIKTGVTETVLKEWKNEIIRAAQDEEASNTGASDNERAEYFRLSQEIREAEALEQFSAVSSHSLSVLVGNSTFFNQAKQLLEDLEKKKLRLAALRSKLLLDGVEERLLENDGLRSLAESVAQTIRDKIMCSLSLIRRRQEMINKEAAYSQQRSKLRKKNDTEKKALKDALSNYNNIVAHCDASKGYVPVEEETVLSGNVAWDSNEGHLRDKMETVEVYNRLLRLREEKKQIESEMLSFLSFYKEKAQQLTSEADLLQSTPCTGGEEMSVPAETVNRARYSTNVQDIFIQAGKRALKLKGVQFCKMQIARGLQYFRRAVTNDPTLLEELQDYEDFETTDEDDDDMDEENNKAANETDLEFEQNELYFP